MGTREAIYKTRWVASGYTPFAFLQSSSGWTLGPKSSRKNKWQSMGCDENSSVLDGSHDSSQEAKAAVSWCLCFHF